MKTIIKTALILIVIVGSVAFTSSKIVRNKVDIKESTIVWKGEKVVGSHTGTIKLEEGYFEMENNELVGGLFTIDMKSITNTDLDGENRAKLVGHLKSDDFFGVEKYPTATLIINSATKNADGYIVKGDITIKGVTEPITFDLDMGEDFASTKLKIDRTKFGVRYGSGSFFDNLGDKAIYDEFELEVTLKF
jgi:polyisoprenoid-binding protein YceI